MTRAILLALNFAAIALVAGCASQPSNTVGSVDFTKLPAATTKASQHHDSNNIKASYYTYIEQSPKKDQQREDAINRLVDLEIDTANDNFNNAANNSLPAPEFTSGTGEQPSQAALSRALTLLETAQRDYQNSPHQDRSLYQLARIYEQLGRAEDSHQTLKKLVQNYPSSSFFSEAQFRLGENAFAKADYLAAEGAFGEVIGGANNTNLIERALYKRGWSRYKQQYFQDAADDFVAAIRHHKFANTATLDTGEQALLNELLRGAALAFYRLPEGTTLESYFANEEFPWLFELYSTLADIHVRQQHFPQAGGLYAVFIQQHTNSNKLPQAYLRLLGTQLAGGLDAEYLATLERFYQLYNPKATYWSEHPGYDNSTIMTGLRKNMVAASALALGKSNTNSFSSASLWSERYLQHFASFAQQDNMFKQYAVLLSENNNGQKALGYFEKAAFDGNMILDKEAAYAALVLNDKMIQQKPAGDGELLNIFYQHSLAFARLYPQDKRSSQLIIRGAQLAATHQQHEKSLELLANLPTTSDEQTQREATSLKARAAFELGQYANAEGFLMGARDSKTQWSSNNMEQQNFAALIIAKQAEQKEQLGDFKAAANEFARVAIQVPNADQGANSLYKAIKLSSSHNLWAESVAYGQQFQKLYPRHELANDVKQLLSTAYVQNHDEAKAAQTLETLAQDNQNSRVKMAALLQAGQLYQQKGDSLSAIRTYKQYVENYPRPFTDYLEASYKLAELYKNQKDSTNSMATAQKMLAEENKIDAPSRTDRSRYLIAWANLHLAQQQQELYGRQRLVEPLAKSLAVKKSTMQAAINYYTQASAPGFGDLTSEATFNIGQIYGDFSKALLQSERPKQLKGEELEQYNMLLEDQSFPFENKAIEFHEINVARLTAGAGNNWITMSLNELKKLLPAKYARQGKISVVE